MAPELDIVIPVYNEGRNIVATLAALKRSVTTPARVLICYDHAEDDTLPAIRANAQAHAGLAVEFVRNRGRGAHAAVMDARRAHPSLLITNAISSAGACSALCVARRPHCQMFRFELAKRNKTRDREYSSICRGLA